MNNGKTIGISAIVLISIAVMFAIPLMVFGAFTIIPDTETAKNAALYGSIGIGIIWFIVVVLVCAFYES